MTVFSGEEVCSDVFVNVNLSVPGESWLNQGLYDPVDYS